MTAASTWDQVPATVGAPNFDNLLAVLHREAPARPTLFEFFLNEKLYNRLAGPPNPAWPAELVPFLIRVYAYRNIGYDYGTFILPGFGFPTGHRERKQTLSLNEGAVIHDRASFESYAWPNPDAGDYGLLDRLEPWLPPGMKLLVHGPCGVLENVNFLVGYENLCYLVKDDPELTGEIFDAVGSRLLRYYENCLRHPAIGAIIGNDDWGFKSQPMLTPELMRRHVLPWHRRIVAAAHAAGRPAVLHSCGNLRTLMDDIIDDLRYDGKHSYEDNIMPVEDAYRTYGRRIAVLGGLDLDFICRSSPDAIHARARAMLALGAAGGYALGSGNSIPEYVPQANYLAMVRAALDAR